MNFIKRLFGKLEKEQKKPVLTTKDQLEKTVKNITQLQDLFGINLTDIDLSKFVKGDSSPNSGGHLKTEYRKRLSTNESDIFEYLEVIKFDSGSHNLIFTNHSCNTLSKEKIKNLLNSMYLLYGSDDDHKNTFTENDWRQFLDPDLEIDFTRNWLNKENQHNVSIDKMDGVLSMTIWVK